MQVSLFPKELMVGFLTQVKKKTGFVLRQTVAIPLQCLKGEILNHVSVLISAAVYSFESFLCNHIRLCMRRLILFLMTYK